MISIAEARRLYVGADAVHDFDHVLRVLRLAERIGRAEGANLSVVRAATLLHDIGRGDAAAAGADHAAVGARRAQEILVGRRAELVEAVAEAIAAHRFRSEPEPASLEAQVLFDADKLDAIGAVGVARAFAYGGAQGQRLWAPFDSVDWNRWEAEGDDPNDHTPVHEFVVKLSRIRDRLFTPTARAIAADRHDTMVAFFERLSEEVRGIA
ncbi:MAG: HD domain-containing protein [Anaerolineae bacterium]